jgi:hypothetical protein
MTLPRMPVRRTAGEIWFGASSSRWQRWAAVTLPLLLLTLLVAAAVLAARLVDERARLQARLQLIDEGGRLAVASATMAERNPPRSHASRLARNEMIERLNTPWPTILDALERTKPASVAITLLEHDAKRGAIALEVKAGAVAQLMVHAQALSDDSTFPAVRLLALESQAEGAGDAGPSMRLELELRRGPSPELDEPAPDARHARAVNAERGPDRGWNHSGSRSGPDRDQR